MVKRELSAGGWNIWFGNLPEPHNSYTNYDIAHLLESSVEFSPPGEKGVNLESLSVAVQAKNQTASGGSYYVFLCATHTPDNSEKLLIKVDVSAGEPGLIMGFAKPVFEQATRIFAQKPVFVGGTLRFNRAAVHPNNAKEIHFRRATVAIIKLLQPGVWKASDEEIAEILSRNIWEVT
jgi:hypothetical protein